MPSKKLNRALLRVNLSYQNFRSALIFFKEIYWINKLLKKFVSENLRLLTCVYNKFLVNTVMTNSLSYTIKRRKIFSQNIIHVIVHIRIK